MAFRVVQQSFWTDEKIGDKFSVEDKYFFLYLLTNPHTNQLGVYKITLKYMAFEMGYSKEQVTVLIDRFIERNLIRYNYETQEIAIGNYLIHSIVRGGLPVYNTLISDINKVTDLTLLVFIHDRLTQKDPKCLNNTILDLLKYLKELLDLHSISILNKNISLNSINDNDNGVSVPDTDPDTEGHSESFDKQRAFDDFWKVYPKKVKKKKAQEIFMKKVKMGQIKGQNVGQIIETVKKMTQTEAWKGSNGQFIPHPSTWLNNEQWNDEVEVTLNEANQQSASDFGITTV